MDHGSECEKVEISQPGRTIVTPLTIKVSGTQDVSALLTVPSSPKACYVLAHGAGAGMNHPFLSAVAHGLAERHCATSSRSLRMVLSGPTRRCWHKPLCELRWLKRRASFPLFPFSRVENHLVAG